MARLSQIYYYNLVFYSRTRRFSIMVPLALAISLINTFLIQFHVVAKPPSVYFFTEANLGYAEILYILIASMFAGDLVSRDFQKEGLFLLTQPISRRKLFFAKFLSALTVSIIAVTVYLFGSFITAYLLYKDIIPSWYQIILISFLAVTALLSLVTLFSAVIKSPTMSITLSVFLLLILFPLAQQILQDVNKTPLFLITYAMQIITNLAQPPPQDSSQPTIFQSLEVFIAYIILGLALSIIIYYKRELTEA